jgi:CRP-like cAMP-binding protein
MNTETDDKIERKYNSCIKSLEKNMETERTSEDMQNIQTYLNTLFYFRRLKLFDPINVDNTISKISKVIKYVSIPKNNYVLKLGEKGNAFYLILKGKVSIMIAEYKKIYLTIEDYLIFLLKLFYFKEKELLKETIFLNKHRYMIEGKFEFFIKNIYFQQKKLEREKIENKLENIKIENSQKDKKSLFTENLMKMIEKIFPELCSSSEEKTISDNFFLDYIFNNNFKENEVTPDKLISLIDIDNYSSYERYLYRPFSIPFYFQINVLERGKYFGHTSLETNSKGSITIITLEDSSFGIIEKNDYFRLLSKINRQLDNNFYSTLYNLPFFQNISKSTFQRFYSSFFEYHLYKRGTILYEMKQKTNIIYLINNGRFSIYIKGNIINICDILIYLQKEKFNRLNKNKNYLNDEEYNSKLKINEKDEKEELIYNKNFKSKEFNDAVFAQNEIYLGNFEGNNLIGLADFVNKKSNSSLFNIKIESNYCELYEISYHNFNIIVSDYPSVNELIEKYEIKKIDLLINKITSYKKIFFSSLNKRENDKILSRLDAQNKEKKIAILCKTQKSFKSEKINKNLCISDKFGKSNIYGYYNQDLERNNWSISCRTLGNNLVNKNLSEKKRRRMIIKEKILEKQNKETFLLENGDLNYRNQILNMRQKLYSQNNSNNNSNKRLSVNKISIAKENSNLIDKVQTKNINNNKQYFISNNFFTDKIKEVLYNNNTNANSYNTINNPFPRISNKKKLYYINMLMNGNNNASSKKILLDKKIKNMNSKSVNKSFRKINQTNYLTIDMTKYPKHLENKIENNKIDSFKTIENFSKNKQKIDEYKQKEKALYNELIINIKKMQYDINLTLKRHKYIDSYTETNNDKKIDDFNC